MTHEATDQHPAQYYIAEDLSPDWLEYQRIELQDRLREAAGGVVFNIQARLACNRLELGINQGSQELTEAAFDDLDTLIRSPEYDMRYPSFYKARVLLATSPTFYARMKRETLSPSDMSKTFANSMDVLEEVVAVKERRSKEYWAMTDLITFGAIARLKQPGYFPYFSTFRESEDIPEFASHDMYVLASPSHEAEPYKDPISLRVRKSSPHTLRFGEVLHTTILAQSKCFRDVGITFVGPDVKQRRYDILSSLLISDSRNDKTTTHADQVILKLLSSKFKERISGEAPT